MLLEPTTFRARIDEAGKLCPSEAGRWAGFLARYKARNVEITIAPERKKRSLGQNAWYHAIIVPYVAEYLTEATGRLVTREQAHYVLKVGFIGTEETPLGPVPISTTTLDTEQFSTFCERIRAHTASEWGLNIPSPGEF